MDFAVPIDHRKLSKEREKRSKYLENKMFFRVKIKESEKFSKYVGLIREQKKKKKLVENVGDTVDGKGP